MCRPAMMKRAALLPLLLAAVVLAVVVAAEAAGASPDAEARKLAKQPLNLGDMNVEKGEARRRKRLSRACRRGAAHACGWRGRRWCVEGELCVCARCVCAAQMASTT